MIYLQIDLEMNAYCNREQELISSSTYLYTALPMPHNPSNSASEVGCRY